MFERPGRPADAFPAPFPNEQAARAANGGAYPPDLSVLAKARTYERGFPKFVFDMFTQYQEQGPDYIAALLTGYKDPPPEGVTLLPGQYYNDLYAGPPHRDAEADLRTGRSSIPRAPTARRRCRRPWRSTARTLPPSWSGWPSRISRRASAPACMVMIFLFIFGGLLYYTKKKIWARMPAAA